MSRAWRLNNIGRCYTDKLCGVNNVRVGGIRSKLRLLPKLHKIGLFGKNRASALNPDSTTSTRPRPQCLSVPSASLPQHPLVHSPSALSLQRVHASMCPLHLHAPYQLLGLLSLHLRVASAKVPVRINFLCTRMLLVSPSVLLTKICPCMCSRRCPVRENCRGVDV